MRNSGWYIPYWRKPKKKSKSNRAGAEEVTRSEEQLEAVRRRWVERYRRTLRALRVLGLSMGSTRGEVQTRYEALRASGATSDRELEDAYRHLLHVLPPAERRKRRPRTGAEAGADQSGEGTAGDDADELSAEAENDDEEDDGSLDDAIESYEEGDEAERSPDDAGGEAV
jgi:hypothetical protein